MNKIKEYNLSLDQQQKTRLLSIAGDPTRARILCYMYDNKMGCVSEIAESLGMSISAISHHLQKMKDNGLFETERSGNNICYILVQNDFTKNLKNILCK